MSDFDQHLPTIAILWLLKPPRYVLSGLAGACHLVKNAFLLLGGCLHKAILGLQELSLEFDVSNVGSGGVELNSH